MSIKCYVGRMGSGKTYEVVTVVILGALRRGRRVVSNIAGLNFDEMKAVLIAEGIDESKIGSIVQVDHEKVMEPFFWRSDKPIEVELSESSAIVKARKVRFFSKSAKPAEDQEFTSPDDYFIQPGDLLVLDEIWRFWSGFSSKDDDGGKRPATVMNFFRMHRHFTHPETGLACDVALITQDIGDVNRSVRAVIEETYYMEKLTAIGSTKRYRVDVHQGGKMTRRPLRSLQRQYEARYFPLYSSHSQKKEGDADAREENIDQRGNILKGALFKVVLPVGVLVLGASVYLVFSFFNPKPKEIAKGKDTPPAANAANAAVPVAAVKSTPDISDRWRSVGFYQSGASLVVVLGDGQMVRTLVDPPNHKFSALSIEAFLPSGESVTPWSGQRHASSPGSSMVSPQ